MGNRLLRTIFAAASVITFSTMILAQNGKQPAAAKAADATAHPDFTGVWLVGGGGEGDYEATPPARRPPMDLTPWAAEQYDYNKDPKAPNGARGRIELDPRGGHCYPPSVYFLMSYGDPFQIIQVTPKQMLFLHEYDHWVRQIWIGEEHPKDLDLSWMGNSVAKWDGDTLVIDTVSMHDESWLDTAGHVYTKDLHMIERVRRPTHERLQIDFTFDDPKTFTKPYKITKNYSLKPDWKILERVYCDDHFKKGIWNNQF